MDRRYTPQSARRMSRASYTDDEDLCRMSDLEGESFRNNDRPFLRRRSSSVSLAASPSSSSQKMSIDSDDARSVSSISTGRGRQLLVPPFPDAVSSCSRRLTRSLSSDLGGWTPSSGGAGSSAPSSSSGAAIIEDLVLDESSRQQERKFVAPIPISSRHPSSSSLSSTSTPSTAEKKQSSQHNRSASTGSGSAAEAGPSKLRADPEKRSVSRRSSLFPKSKALARVISQTDEETRLADIEMRRERDMTQQLKSKQLTGDLSDTSKVQSPMPAVPWARISPTIAPYQCSKLNPEMEMTNFQFENLPSPVQQGYKSIKRKASEDRFETYSSTSLKRRAVSPSVSASGSPVLTGISSPPYALYGSSPTSNAAARAQQKPAQLSSSSFNLQDASGSLSRMSLSE